LLQKYQYTGTLGMNCNTLAALAAPSAPDNADVSHLVSILIPCKNEELAIERVISEYRSELPYAEIIVCDNNSTDRTAEVAAAAGARVVRESRPGKGNAVRKLFCATERAICVLVDGDGTYASKDVHKLIQPVIEGHADLVVGRRRTAEELLNAAYRKGHRFGNKAFSWAMSKMFGSPLDDVFSGYRVMSRRFVKSFPCLSSGFEIETELTVHALSIGMTVAEIDSEYGDREEGSVSKLNTYRDGARIGLVLIYLYSQVKPKRFFGALALLLSISSLFLGVPVIIEFMQTGLVPRFPTAILASALMLLAAIFAGGGLVLDSVSRGRREMKRLFYLMH
jgi:glycosyltransferase involved in cell wall biosynthesis